MNRLLACLIVPAAFAAGTEVLAHERISIPVSRQDSGRLKIVRAWGEQHHDKIRVHGWVKRPFSSYGPVAGRLRVEAWNDSECIGVRHARWSQLYRHQIGTYAVSMPLEHAVSSIRVTHVGWNDPETCPVAAPQ